MRRRQVHAVHGLAIPTPERNGTQNDPTAISILPWSTSLTPLHPSRDSGWNWLEEDCGLDLRR